MDPSMPHLELVPAHEARGLSTHGGSNTHWIADIGAEWHRMEVLLHAAESRSARHALKVGHMLMAAEGLLPRRQYEVMVRQQLPFNKATASKLKRIAGDQRIAAVSPGKLPGWTILYELSLLTDVQFEELEASGRIKPGLARVEVIKFRKGDAGEEPEPEPTPSLIAEFREWLAAGLEIDELATAREAESTDELDQLRAECTTAEAWYLIPRIVAAIDAVRQERGAAKAEEALWPPPMGAPFQ
jgi:hypothetical protein